MRHGLSASVSDSFADTDTDTDASTYGCLSRICTATRGYLPGLPSLSGLDARCPNFLVPFYYRSGIIAFQSRWIALG